MVAAQPQVYLTFSVISVFSLFQMRENDKLMIKININYLNERE